MSAHENMSGIVIEQATAKELDEHFLGRHIPLNAEERAQAAGEGAESAEEMETEQRTCWDCGSTFTRKLSEPLAKGGMCVRCYVQDKL